MDRVWKAFERFGGVWGGAVAAGTSVMVLARMFDGLPLSVSIVGGLLGVCCLLWLYQNGRDIFAQIAGKQLVATTKAAKVEANTSPFLLWLQGDSSAIEIATEAGPHGDHRVLKFDLVNSGPTQVEDVEVYISGLTLNHTALFVYPIPFDRVYLQTRHHSKAINPGQRSEFVLMSLGTQANSLPFWGDHKIIEPPDRKYAYEPRDPQREGQHFVEVRVAAKNAAPKKFDVHIIVAGGAPTILPVDGRRYVTKA
jgi:hypothetical protein